ncbi:energy-coupling factor ABC transporter ATP-binding protein [Candidatus Infernicultor aquiphilus]|nr:MAG: energy-coupling factor ABC transporter ATP-binding protein [Candidatus Atribacteria bacterium CG2_30_33_13]
MKEKEPIIKLVDLSFAYPYRDYVFNKLNFNFYQGDRIGLLGPNGSGKTTLFQLIMGLLKPNGGKIEIFGKKRRTENDFIEVREKIGLLFQDPDDQLFSPTVAEDIAFGPLNLRKSNQETKKILKDTLELLGLSNFEDRITYNLSYGEKRLVSMATVWAMQPKILLLDEPVTWLDEKTIAKMIQILNNNPYLSYIIISHDKKFLKETTNCIYLMDNGKINKI